LSSTEKEQVIFDVMDTIYSIDELEYGIMQYIFK